MFKLFVCLLFSQCWWPQPVHSSYSRVRASCVSIIHHGAVVGRGIEPLSLSCSKTTNLIMMINYATRVPHSKRVKASHVIALLFSSQPIPESTQDSWLLSFNGLLLALGCTLFSNYSFCKHVIHLLND